MEPETDFDTMTRFLYPLALLFVACGPAGEPPPAPSPTVATAGQAPAVDTLPPVPTYDWTRPAATFELDEALREISGLTVLADGRLAAVQDEEGIVYTLDPATGRIAGQRTFRGAGDYEGIEATPEALWVLRSNGTLHELPSGGGPEIEHDTPLKGRCDAEGLAYDARHRRLLIACKEDPGEDLEDVRAIYAFDLASKRLVPEPAFLLQRDDVDGEERFKPSALAVHPESGRLYVLSSVRKAVAVLDPEGALEALVPLSDADHAQPEGLAFAEGGVLYLANEGPEGRATLMRFDPVRP